MKWSSLLLLSVSSLLTLLLITGCANHDTNIVSKGNESTASVYTYNDDTTEENKSGTVQELFGNNNFGSNAYNATDCELIFEIEGTTVSVQQLSEDFNHYSDLIYNRYATEENDVYKYDQGYSIQYDTAGLLGAVSFSMMYDDESYYVYYGTDFGIPISPDSLDFNVNGVSIGNSKNILIETFGEPNETKTYADHNYSLETLIYLFENGKQMSVGIIEGKIINFNIEF